MDGKRALGEHYEGVAARYLQRHGLTIVARNVYNRGGEIDLIARDAGTLVFVEVRFRGEGSLTDPLSSITYSKRQKLIRAVSFYLHRHGLWDHPCRIDVVGITPGVTSKYRVQWARNAIQAA